MMHYGSVKGFIYRSVQPEPVLKCKVCGKKFPEHDLRTGEGEWSGLCRKCRVRQREAYVKALESDEERKSMGESRTCCMCGRRKPVAAFVGHGGKMRKTCRQCLERQRERKAK